MGDRLTSFVLLIALLAQAAPAVAASQDERDPVRFASDLRTLADQVASANPATAAEVEKTIPAVWTVRHGDGRYDVPAGWLQSALRRAAAEPAKWPDDRATLVRRLTALAREAEALRDPAERPAAIEARAALDRVLADPEFSRLHADSAMQQVWTRLVEWFARMLRRLGLGGIANAATAEVIAWTLSLAAFGALVIWVIGVVRRTAGHSRLPVTAPPPARSLSAPAWARRAAAAEDIREAVRCAYRAAVTRLEEEGVWREDAARTPREYVRLLPDGHRRRRTVLDLARRFEEIWYGARPATDDDRRSLLGTLRELECLPVE